MSRSQTVVAAGVTLSDPTATHAAKQAAMRSFNGAVALQRTLGQLTERQKLIVGQYVGQRAAEWFEDKQLRSETKFSTWLTGQRAYTLSTPALIMAADALAEATYGTIFFSFGLKQIDDGLYVCRVVVNKRVLPDVD